MSAAVASTHREKRGEEAKRRRGEERRDERRESRDDELRGGETTRDDERTRRREATRRTHRVQVSTGPASRPSRSALGSWSARTARRRPGSEKGRGKAVRRPGKGGEKAGERQRKGRGKAVKMPRKGGENAKERQWSFAVTRSASH